jgi:predicted nucleotidyltransferase
MIEDKIKNEIIGKISIKKPYKVFLFGSHAYGTPGSESDVDLLVVMDKEGIPNNYQEKSENYLEISRLLRDINKKISIDILVMTKTQWHEFINKKSGFSREILARGIELI